MTIRLYENDTFAFDLDAALVSRSPLGEGEEIVLDRTVFFAPSGGQPGDRGTIENVPVVEVIARGDAIVHVTAAPIPASIRPGDRVRGRVDAARRLDAMRQHHGQHLLSAAFAKTAELETTSVHFGDETSTLDLSAIVDDATIEKAVDLANSIVLDDRAVRVHNVTRADLGRFHLRREPGVESESLRIVEVEGFDATPCSGTHPTRTGQVGPIAVIGVTKVRNASRLTIVCGERAIRDARAKDSALRAMGRTFSVSPLEVEASVEKLRVSEREARRRLRLAEEAMAESEARDRVSKADDYVVVADLGADRTEEGIAFLAGRIVALGRAAVLGGQIDGRAFVAVAAPRGKPLDAAAALSAGIPMIEGRGGGNVGYARGAGPRTAGLKDALEAAARELRGRSSAGSPGPVPGRAGRE